MAYGEAREAGPGRIILIGVLIALVGLGLILWLALSNPFIQDKLGISPEQRTRRTLLADPERGLLYRTIERTYPDEFASLVATLVEEKNADASDADTQEAGRSFLQGALTRHQMDLLRAPHARLAALRTAELKLFEAMAPADPKACRDYVLGGPVPDAHADTKVRTAAIGTEIAGWQAAADGRDHGVQLTSLIRDPRDTAAFIKAIGAEGMTLAKIREFALHGGPRGAPAADTCAFGAASLRAFARMPADQSDRVFRITLRRSS